MSETQSSSHHPPRTARWGPWKEHPSATTETKKLKLLFLHGFCASPRELRPLGRFLARDGFEGVAPLLPGHGERLAGMNSCHLEDWVEAVKISFEALHADRTPVALVGFCLGGSLALATARELNPKGIVCLAAPVTPLERSLFPTASAMERIVARNESPEPLLTQPFFSQSSSETLRHWRERSGHGVTTQRFVDSYQNCIKKAANDLKDIRCHVLAFNSPLDPVAGRLAINTMSSTVPDLTQVFVGAPSHTVHLEPDRYRTYSVIRDFLRALVPSGEVVF